MSLWDQFTGVNAGYVHELYERFRRDPNSVDEATRAAFAHWSPESAAVSDPAAETAVRPEDTTAAIAAFNLAESIRRFGHLAARLDPLGVTDPIGDPSLRPETHGLTNEMLQRLPASIVGGPAAEGAATALEAIERLRAIYCRTTGHDYNHIFVPAERTWLRESVETCRFRPPKDPINARDLLDRISQVEAFERFLQRTFPGKTRFSIEGLDMMIPILDEIINDAATAGVKHVMIAMAHRGRLNVLAHIMQKSYAQVLAEFKDPLACRPRVDG
jgi:2-oxoglutarate dehydrogenase E1 component